MPAELPMVSLIVPCRNERGYIRACLDSLAASDYPAGRLEILVVDGMSDDGTPAIVREWAQANPVARLIESPRRTTPAALNVGIAHARGSVFMRADAHAEFPRTYVRDLVEWLERSGADGVGGMCRTLPGAETPAARAIALALAHPFGVGNSWFRIGTSEPRLVDTVPFGCYRMQLFERLGGFDEELVRNQDDEFNLRIIRSGGRVLLVPDVVSRYYARTRLRDVARMFYQYGFFKPAVIRKVGAVMTLRQLVPAAFTATLAALLLLAPWNRAAAVGLAALASVYGLADLAAASSAGRGHGARTVAALLVVFPLLHLSYGGGFLVGLATPFRRRAGGTAAPDAVPLSR